MNFAQITNGIVTAVGTSQPDDTWQHCGNTVSIGWTFDGNSFVAPISVTPSPTPPTAQQILQANAYVALSKSDIVVTRCYSAGVIVPSTWQTYRAELRAISNGTNTTSTVLPTMPAYPTGT